MESTFAVAFHGYALSSLQFFTNKKYVFKNETQSKNEFWKVFVSFYGARGITFFAEEAIFLVFYDWLGFSKVIVTFASQVIIFIANYILSKLFVLKKKERKR